MLAGLEGSGRVLERPWPASEPDELSRTEFIHDHPSVAVDPSLILVDLEQGHAFRMLSRYFDLVRERREVGPRRMATRIPEFMGLVSRRRVRSRTIGAFRYNRTRVER